MADATRSADVMQQTLLSNIDQLKTGDTAAVVTQAANVAKSVVPAFASDVWVYRLVVSFLGVAVLAVIVCYAAEPKLPDGLVAIGAAAVGALAGLLAPSPNSR